MLINSCIYIAYLMLHGVDIRVILSAFIWFVVASLFTYMIAPFVEKTGLLIVTAINITMAVNVWLYYRE